MALSTSASAAEGHFDRALAVTGPVEITIRTGAGTIAVKSGEDSRVHVHGTIRAGGMFFSGQEAEKSVRYFETHPPIEQHGNSVIIGADKESRFQHNVSISYELVVPAATRLKSRTGSGEQTFRGFDGPLEASSGSGNIRASEIGGDASASTGSGGIELEAVKGAVRASTGSGGIQALGIGGSFRATTGSGNITLEQKGVADARVTSASGNITLRKARGLVHAKTTSGWISAEGGGHEPWHLEAVSGNISARIPLDLGFELHAHTVSGSISTNRPLTLQGTVNRREVSGRAGNGGFLLDVSTVSGNIHIDWTPLPKAPSD